MREHAAVPAPAGMCTAAILMEEAGLQVLLPHEKNRLAGAVSSWENPVCGGSFRSCPDRGVNLSEYTDSQFI